MSLYCQIRYRGGLAIATDRMVMNGGAALPPKKKLALWGPHAVVSTTSISAISLNYPAGPWKHPAGFETNLPHPISASVDFDAITKSYIARTPFITRASNFTITPPMPISLYSLAEEQRRAFHAAFDGVERRLWPGGQHDGSFVGVLCAYYDPEVEECLSAFCQMTYRYTQPPVINSIQTPVGNTLWHLGYTGDQVLTDPLYSDVRADSSFAKFLQPHAGENDKDEVIAFLRRFIQEASRFRSPVKGIQSVSAECDIALIEPDGVTWSAPEPVPVGCTYACSVTVNPDMSKNYEVAAVSNPTFATISLPPQTTLPPGGPYITNYLGVLVLVMGGTTYTLPTATTPGFTGSLAVVTDVSCSGSTLTVTKMTLSIENGVVTGIT